MQSARSVESVLGPSTGAAEVVTVPGLEFPRTFTRDGIDPFDEVEWEIRSAVIGNEKGEVVFEQRDVEIPEVLVAAGHQHRRLEVLPRHDRHAGARAQRQAAHRPRRRHDHRVGARAEVLRERGRPAGVQRRPEAPARLPEGRVQQPRLVQLRRSRRHPQCSACFINSVQDTMESILGLAKTEGMLFKFGSGTGSNLSAIRSSRELLAGGGTASGPVSFMKGFDAFAGVIKSGGKTRRAAKMVILNADHPDIVEFINCKVEEEKKAWALIDAGYDGSFTGPAYASVFFQNSNNSVRVTDEFMRAVLDDGEWRRRRCATASRWTTYKARDLMRQIAEATHICGDPGMQFDTTVNDWHTCPNTARINASNPCSEYMFLDDSACNLASINLMKFVERGRRVRRRRAFERACRDAHHRAGDPRRQLELSDAGDRAEQPRLPAARPRLREPRRAADVARPAVRQRRRPRLCGGDHGADARRGVRAVGARRARSRRAVRRLREEPRAVPARHAQAPRGAQGHRPHARAEGPVRGARSRSGTRSSSSASSTASATRRRPCSRRPARSAS